MVKKLLRTFQVYFNHFSPYLHLILSNETIVCFHVRVNVNVRMEICTYVIGVSKVI